MRFGVLGPLQAHRDDGSVVPVRGGKVRKVLAVLLSRAGNPVTAAELIDGLWGHDAPPSASKTLRIYVSRLRRDLDEPHRIVAGPAGYSIAVAEGELDAHDFLAQIQDSAESKSEGRLQPAADHLDRALALWRGAPYGGIESCAMIEPEVVRLDELRVRALEDRADIGLQSGRHAELAPELSALAARYPLRERPAGQLMLALYRSGRQGDALQVYRRTRSLMVDELGVEPGESLKDLHEAVLRLDPALEWHADAEHVVDPPREADEAPADPGGPRAEPTRLEVPAQLPADVGEFVGRGDELGRLAAVLTGPARRPSALVTVAVSGMAGVGKTALALRTAHRIAEQYQDGQLFIDLHGYAEGRTPVDPGEALDRMLRALGVPGDQIPARMDERAALYRTRLSGRRVLIVLDNAATEEQVRPLLPGAPGCLVLITSRRWLAGLDHTHMVSLDPLPSADAVGLLIRATRDERLTTQPSELLAEAVELCGRLPLAIRIAAARLRYHPTWSLGHLVGRLREHRHRLTELEAGHRSVTAALDLSYQQLTDDLRRSYRLLALHPGPHLTVHASASLIDAPIEQAARHLDRLFEAHLLQEPVVEQWRFHELVRAHAAQVAITDHPEPDRHAALDRLCDHYAQTAATATDRLFPHESHRLPPLAPTGTPMPDLRHTTKATAWLEAELANLLAIAHLAADHGRVAPLRRLSRTLHACLRNHAHYAQAETLHQRTLEVAHAGGDRAGELEALIDLGEIRHRQGLPELAVGHFEAAVNVAQAIGDQSAELDARLGAGVVHRQQGRYRQAIAIFQGVLDAAIELERHASALVALGGLGDVHRLQGRYESSAGDFDRILEIALAIGDRRAELAGTLGLGNAHRLLHRYERAVACFRQALDVAEATGYRVSKLNATVGLGDVFRRQGLYEQAAASFQHVLDYAREIGHRNWQFEALQGLGRVHHATGRVDAAIACHEQALAIATELGQPEDQARAHDGLAHTDHTLERHEHARRHWRRALDLLTAVGTEHTEDEETTAATIRAHLADLDRPAEGDSTP